MAVILGPNNTNRNHSANHLTHFGSSNHSLEDQSNPTLPHIE